MIALYLCFLYLDRPEPAGRPRCCPPRDSAHVCWVALLVESYLSNTASCVLCVLCCVKDHNDLLYHSPLLKKTCVGQVVLDKWFPLSMSTFVSAISALPHFFTRARARRVHVRDCISEGVEGTVE